tara:strand:+ start:61 stop:162 length:102 start_codon:yes stop_codon:yes gene_type:complete
MDSVLMKIIKITHVVVDQKIVAVILLGKDLDGE